MEAASWKLKVAVASFLAFLVQLVVRLLVPDYVTMSGAATSYFIAGWIIVMAFFLPFLWWRTTVGYIAGVIFGIFGVATSALALITLVAPGELAAEAAYILIPGLVFALLLIVGSVLAWREG